MFCMYLKDFQAFVFVNNSYLWRLCDTYDRNISFGH